MMVALSAEGRGVGSQTRSAPRCRRRLRRLPPAPLHRLHRRLRHYRQLHQVRRPRTSGPWSPDGDRPVVDHRGARDATHAAAAAAPPMPPSMPPLPPIGPSSLSLQPITATVEGHHRDQQKTNPKTLIHIHDSLTHSARCPRRVDSVHFVGKIKRLSLKSAFNKRCLVVSSHARRICALIRVRGR